MGEQAEVCAQAGKRQRQKPIDPAQKGPWAVIALREIAVEQHHIPHHHQAIPHRNGKQHPFQYGSTQNKDEQIPQPEGQRDRRQKRAQDAPVILDGGQVTHAVPVQDHLGKKP